MAAGGGGWGGIMADVPVFEVPDEPGAAAGNAAGGVWGQKKPQYQWLKP